MNENIIKLGLAAGLLNNVDNETPSHYFIDAHADIENVRKFAELIVQECADVCERFGESGDGYTCSVEILEHFGVE